MWQGRFSGACHSVTSDGRLNGTDMHVLRTDVGLLSVNVTELAIISFGRAERIPRSHFGSALILAHQSSLLRKIVRGSLCSILDVLLPPGFV